MQLRRRVGAKRRRPARAPGYRYGGAAKQQASFKKGPMSVMSNLGSQRMQTCFTTCTSGNVSQINVIQNPSGDTSWYSVVGGPLSSVSLTGQTTLENFVMTIASVPITVPFPSALTYADLYDFYTIERVEVTMFVGSNWMNIAGDTAGTDVSAFPQPVIAYAVDSDDANGVTQQQLLSYGNVQLEQPTLSKPITFSYRPSATADLGNSVGAAGTGPVFSPKVSTLTPGVGHYGFKMIPMGFSAFNGTPASFTATVNFIVRQYVTFSDRRTLGPP